MRQRMPSAESPTFRGLRSSTRPASSSSRLRPLLRCPARSPQSTAASRPSAREPQRRWSGQGRQRRLQVARHRSRASPRRAQRSRRFPQPQEELPTGQTRRAQAASSGDRRSPADRSSHARRGTRRAPSVRPRRSGRRSRPPILLLRKRRGSRRSTRGGRVWPCIQTASGSTRSFRRSGPSRRRTPRQRQGRPQGCRWARRDRRRGAGRPRRGAIGRTRTAAAPGRRRATSRRVHRRQAAHTHT